MSRLIPSMSDESHELLDVLSKLSDDVNYLVKTSGLVRRFGLVIEVDGSLKRVKSYSGAAVDELIAWGFIELRGITCGRIPDYAGRLDCDTDIGSFISITVQGRDAAQDIRESESV